MNYFKTIVALLASASLVAVAAYPSSGAHRIRRLDWNEVQELLPIIDECDDPARLARELRPGNSRLQYSWEVTKLMGKIVRERRHALFHYLLPLIDFGEGRNGDLSGLLRYALSVNDIEIADFLMGQGIQVDPSEEAFWKINSRPKEWDLEEMKAFLLRHREEASALAPRAAEMRRVANAAEAEAIIALARYCNQLSNTHDFDSAAFLEQLTSAPYSWRDDPQMAHVFIALMQEGGDLSPDARDLLKGLRPRAYQELQDLNKEDIKEPGCA
jgi:hypothetical protein